MSTHKTTVDQELVISFLKDSFSPDISDFQMIVGGEGSQAYSFKVNDDEYIIRINKHNDHGFKKDEYAFVHFLTPVLPIPKIYKVGKINEELRYCISEKARGKILNEFSAVELEVLLPKMFETLDAIHASNISGTSGYGKWEPEDNAEGNAKYESWEERLIAVDTFAKGHGGGPSLFDTTFLEKSFWDPAHARLAELAKLCPEERFLLHGDYGFNNVLSDGSDITGVIDWEGSAYGDFLFDVAWLSFWSYNLDYQKLYLVHAQKRGIALLNYDERLLCYKLYIGLSSMSFFAYSGQKEKYDKTKMAVGKLLVE